MALEPCYDCSIAADNLRKRPNGFSWAVVHEGDCPPNLAAWLDARLTSS